MIQRRVTPGFTVIELLIAAAIIAVLAAVALPNYLEAQLRSKVSQVKGDMRSLGAAIESYAADYKHYPFDFADDVASPYYLHHCITTPVVYMPGAARMKDTFAIGAEPLPYPGEHGVRERFRYRAFKEKWLMSRAEGGLGVYNLPGPGAPGIDEAIRVHGAWFLVSKGPAGHLNLPIGFADGRNAADWLWLPYDPTNGTRSPGQVIRSQKLLDVNAVGYDRYASTYRVP